MKLFVLIVFPFLFLSCSGSAPLTEPEEEPDKTPSEEVIVPPEEDVPPINDPLEFVAPNTTGELLQEEDKETVSGPAAINTPGPEPDSAIDVKPTAAPTE